MGAKWKMLGTGDVLDFMVIMFRVIPTLYWKVTPGRTILNVGWKYAILGVDGLSSKCQGSFISVWLDFDGYGCCFLSYSDIIPMISPKILRNYKASY